MENKITQKQVDKAWDKVWKARDKAWDKAWEAREAREARDKAWELERRFKEQEAKQ